MKKNTSIHSLRCENIEDKQFEELLEKDLLDIEDFLDSYTVNKVEEEKIDNTIEALRMYMPKQEIQIVKSQENILDKIAENIDLLKFQISLMNKSYFIASLLLILLGTITTTKLNLSMYMSASIVAPIPILLGIFEIIKGREENVWELELSYKYSLREIVLSRLIIINVVSISTSIFISVMLNNTYSQISILKMISIWLVPVFLIGSISLIITSLYRSINGLALCISIYILGVMAINIYEKISDIANINIFIVLAISIVSLIASIKLFYKRSINSIDYRNFDF